MFDLSSKIRQSDRLARALGGAALLLAASGGLVAAWLIPRSGPAVPAEPVRPVQDVDERLLAVEMKELIGFCARHTTEQRGFVVFAEGSAVMVSGTEQDAKTRALAILARCARPDAAFMTEKSREQDLIVTFAEPVLHWFPAAQIPALDRWSESHLEELLAPGEKAKQPAGWRPDAAARIGLMARQRMLQDARERKIVRIILPQPTEPAPGT